MTAGARSGSRWRRLAAALGIVFGGAVPAGPLPAAAASPANPDAIAVLIGNRDYGEAAPAVRFAHRDAAAMRRYVTQGLGFLPENIIDLRDATLAELQRVFGSRDHARGTLFNWVRAGRSDVFVYYSGHGVPGPRDKRGYLLPVDGDADLAELTGYGLDQLYANLAALPARSVTVALDACFSGTSHAGVMLRDASGLSVQANPAKADDALTVFTAAAGDQVASWDERARHGLFTHHFLRAVGGAADGEGFGNGDRQVTVGEIEAYLGDELRYQARRRFDREQQPQVMGDRARVMAAIDHADPARFLEPPATAPDAAEPAPEAAPPAAPSHQEPATAARPAPVVFPPPPAAQARALAPAPAAPTAVPLAGSWQGAYQCQQDRIGISLEVTEQAGAQVSAVVAFFPLAGQPSFAGGSYQSRGRFDAARGRLQLAGERWIERPPGFQMHDLEATLAGGALQGRILTTGCGALELSRR